MRGPRLPGQIFVINADGSGLRQITHSGDNRWPAWSHDGSRIAFVHDGVLFTMAPDGTDMRPVSGIHPDGPIAWNWAP
jgi:Tol biopolymer transport system component